jgi:hypothetical protein
VGWIHFVDGFLGEAGVDAFGLGGFVRERVVGLRKGIDGRFCVRLLL